MNPTTQENAMTESQHPPIPKGYWQDAHGSLTPESKIKPIDRARTELVTEALAQARQMSATLLQFKAALLERLADFEQRSASEYGAKVGGKKGNITLVSYDGRYKLMRAMQDTLVFDERLQVAKLKIDECVHAWAKGANKNIQALVNHAFQVDQAGKVSTKRILALRQLDIEDPAWQEAMRAIADSMTTASSKAYVRFYERNDATGEYVAVPLDVTSL
jgi:hypothetical protein